MGIYYYYILKLVQHYLIYYFYYKSLCYVFIFKEMVNVLFDPIFIYLYFILIITTIYFLFYYLQYKSKGLLTEDGPPGILYLIFILIILWIGFLDSLKFKILLQEFVFAYRIKIRNSYLNWWSIRCCPVSFSPSGTSRNYISLDNESCHYMLVPQVKEVSQHMSSW